MKLCVRPRHLGESPNYPEVGLHELVDHMVTCVQAVVVGLKVTEDWSGWCATVGVTYSTGTCHPEEFDIGD